MARSRLPIALGALWLLGCFAPARVGDAPRAVVLSPDAGPALLGEVAALAVDVDPALQHGDVEAGAAPFARYDVPRPTFRGGEGTLWAALEVEVPPGGAGGPWVLAFDHPRPRAVTLHWVDEAGAPTTKRAGLTLPAAAHDVPSRAVVLRLPLPAEGPRRFLLRVDTFPLGLNAVLRTEASLHAAESLGALVQGLYYGGALGLVAFNLVLFGLLKRRGFALFGALGLLQAFFFLGRNGWLWRLGLWTATPRHLGGLVASLHVVVLLLFTAEVLGTKETAPRAHRWLRRGVGAALANALVAAVGLGQVADPVGMQLALLSTLFVAAVAVRQLLRGEPGAGAYLAGHAAYLGGTLLYLAKSFGWVEHTPFTEHAMQAGSALNLVLSALALVGHVRAVERRHRDAQAQLVLLEARRERDVEQVRAEGLTRALRAQDEERHRIARDLHDGLGHLLLELKALVAAQPTIPARLQALPGQALALVRAVSQALYPTELQTLGLAAALQATAERATDAAGVRLALAIEPLDGCVAREVQPAVLRIVQEALRNALTHGQPTVVSVEAAREGAEVVVAVTDDGKGLDAAAHGEGSGLRNMRERAALAGGTLSLDSAPGEGTRVELRLPVASAPA